MSTWPGTVPTYTTKVDIVDVVQAAHPNALQDDVTAIATNLGTNPHISTAVSSTDTFNPSSVTYTNVKLRLANIEKGVVGDSHSQYVKIAGGSTILPTTGTPVNLVVQAKSGSSANLTEWRNSAGTLVTWVDSTGGFNSTGGVFASASDVDNLKALLHMSN